MKQGNEYSIKKYISIASNLSLKDKEVKKYMYNNLDLLTNLGFDKAEKNIQTMERNLGSY